MPASAEDLKKVPLFANLEKRDLERLAGRMRERAVSAGDPLSTQGEGAIAFFVIADGEAQVSSGGADRRTLGPGDYFGEMALIEGDTRSASVTATSDLRCFGMAAWEFRPFVREHPDVAWQLMQTLVSRLREAEAR